MSPVETLTVTLKLQWVLLSGMLRHGPAIMCRILVFVTNRQWAPDWLDALTVAQFRAIPVHGGFPRTSKDPGRVWTRLPETHPEASVLYIFILVDDCPVEL